MPDKILFYFDANIFQSPAADKLATLCALIASRKKQSKKQKNKEKGLAKSQPFALSKKTVASETQQQCGWSCYHIYS